MLSNRVDSRDRSDARREGAGRAVLNEGCMVEKHEVDARETNQGIDVEEDDTVKQGNVSNHFEKEEVKLSKFLLFHRIMLFKSTCD